MSHKFKSYHNSITSYNILHKYNYVDVSQLPEFTKAVLTINMKRFSSTTLLAISLFLQSFTSQKCLALTTSKDFTRTNVRVRKGDPVGFKVTLRRNQISLVLQRLSNHLKSGRLSELTSSSGTNQNGVCSLVVKDALTLAKLEGQYKYFRDIDAINISLVTSARDKKELEFLLTSANN